MSVTIKIEKNNKAEILRMLNEQVLKAAEACGIAGEAYAVKNIDEKHIIDTSNLKINIIHEVEDGEKVTTVQIGTNVKYAIYNELGTGIYVVGGRDTPWAFQDIKGEWHRTQGMRARPFLKPALEDHIDKYKEIIENNLKT